MNIQIEKVTEEMHEIINPYVREYIFFGGFPEVVLGNSNEEKNIF